MKKEPEIIYKKKGIKAPILWEKTYYNNNTIDESKNLKGEPTGKWSGICFLYRFVILQGSTKNRFLIEPIIESYEGQNEEEMVGDLQKKIGNKEEWILGEKHWKDANFFPKEVNTKLKEYNLEKYVKKIS